MLEDKEEKKYTSKITLKRNKEEQTVGEEQPKTVPTKQKNMAIKKNDFSDIKKKFSTSAKYGISQYC